MKLAVAVIVVVLLMVASYHIRPDIEAAVGEYWLYQIEAMTNRSELSVQQRHDELLVLSLNFRQANRTDLAWSALLEADTLMSDQALTKALIGLYSMESGRDADAIAYWNRGARLDPEDPNLQFLATLDSLELQYVDKHMLESMFVDSVINARLDVSLYHLADTDLMQAAERTERIEGAVDKTFIISGIAALLILFWSIGRLRRARRRRAARKKAEAEAQPKVCSSEPESEPDDILHTAVKPIRYMIVFSSMLKIGQVSAALFNYFMLGTDLSEFVSDYVYTPANLLSLFTENILFVMIFIAIVIVELVRRTMMGRATV